jgi:AraC-like DNA-binding protein
MSEPGDQGPREARGARVDEVRRALGRLLFNGRPHIREVAAATDMSVRTLQRRLAETGLTYSAVVDELRAGEARRRLAEPEVLMKQVAADLGFCEPASFTRACRRWTGLSPREYRRQLRQASRGGGPLPASQLQT